MNSVERQLKVQEVFTNEEFLSLNELSSRLSASRSSLRRDLIELEKKGVLRRVHGGAIAATRDDGLDYRRLLGSRHDEKARIGQLASTLIENGQNVILGGGSTVVEVARNLVDRPMQIITNSIPVAEVFGESIKVEVTMTGGYVFPRLGLLLGPICERTLNELSADVLVMGVRGITETGLCNNSAQIVQSIRKMIEVSEKIIIVADSSKFGKKAMLQVAELDVIDAVVSDGALMPEYQEMLAHRGIQLFLA